MRHSSASAPLAPDAFPSVRTVGQPGAWQADPPPPWLRASAVVPAKSTLPPAPAPGQFKWRVDVR